MPRTKAHTWNRADMAHAHKDSRRKSIINMQQNYIHYEKMSLISQPLKYKGKWKKETIIMIKKRQGKKLKKISIVQIRKMSSSSPQGQILINDE